MASPGQQDRKFPRSDSQAGNADDNPSKTVANRKKEYFAVLRTRTNSDVKKRENHTAPAKANPRDSQTGRRLPGHSGRELPAVAKNNPTMAPSSMSADRNSPSIRPNIGRIDCVTLDQLIAKAKSQIARFQGKECYVTAQHWDFAETLEQIRSLCKKQGDWERALRKIGLRRQRAWEYLKYRELFASRADAAACPVLKANGIIRKAIKAEDAADWQDKPVDLSSGSDHGDTGATIPLPGSGEKHGTGDPVTGSSGFGTKNRKSKATLGVRTGVGDEFYTPAYAVSPLLPYLSSNQVIWECAWGTGELAKHLRAAGHNVVGGGGMDFMKEPPPHWDIIVTNPPYSHKNAFLERAYSLGKPFAFLLPVESLGGGRVRLYRQHGIELLVPSKRINFYDAHGQANAASFPTAWFCWKLLPSPLVFVEVDW